MKIRQISLSARLLAIVYLLYVVGSLPGLLGGGLPIMQLGLMVANIITLLAIATDIGNWARIVGLIYGCILVTFAFVAFFSADWRGLPDLTGDAVFIIIGFLMLGLGVWTINVLRHKVPETQTSEE